RRVVVVGYCLRPRKNLGFIVDLHLDLVVRLLLPVFGAWCARTGTVLIRSGQLIRTELLKLSLILLTFRGESCCKRYRTCNERLCYPIHLNQRVVFSLKLSNLLFSSTRGNLLLSELMSVVSASGSRTTPATSLSLRNTFVTFCSLVLQISAGIVSISFVPSLYFHSIITGITSPPRLLSSTS